MPKWLQVTSSIANWATQLVLIGGSAYLSYAPGTDKYKWLVPVATTVAGQVRPMIGPGVTAAPVMPMIVAIIIGMMLVATPAEAQAVCNTNTNPTNSVCGPNNNVQFVVPTTNTDGSPLNDYASARIIFGSVSPLCTAQGLPTVGATVKDVGNLGVPPTPLVNTTKQVVMGTLGMPNGALNITVQATNAVGSLSACAPPVSFTFQGKTPGTPTGVQAGP